MDARVLEHFGLPDDPFISLPGGPLLQTRDVKAGRKILDRLLTKGGLAAFIAESGGGKSTIWRSFMAKRQDPCIAFVIPYLSDYSRRTAREFATEIIKEIGDERATFPKSTTAVNRLLRETMGRWADENKRVLMVVEEAHHLNHWVRLAFKMFVEMQWHSRGPLLGILLVGHAGLRTTLENHAEVGDRTLIYPLKGMSHNELRAYIRLRIQAMGGDPAVFDPAAINEIAKTTGCPRRVNRLCRDALVRAYFAGRKAVTAAEVKGLNGESEIVNLQAMAEKAKGMGIDQMDVAKLLGKSKATVSLGISGQYASGDPAALRKEILNAYEELMKQRAA